jgi:hypothetical protein
MNVGSPTESMVRRLQDLHLAMKNDPKGPQAIAAGAS